MDSVSKSILYHFGLTVLLLSSLQGEITNNDTHLHEFKSIFAINMCCHLNLKIDSGSTNCGDETPGSPAINILLNPQENADSNWTFPENLMTSREQTTFRLQVNKPSCTMGSVLNKFTVEQDAKNVEFHIQPDGFLGIGLTAIGSDYYNLNQFCLNGIDKSAKTQFEFRTCKPTCTLEEPCIQKCCPLDSVVTRNGSQWTCQTGVSKLSPIYYEINAENLTSDVSSEQKLSSSAFYFIHNPMTWQSDCAASYDNVFLHTSIETEARSVNDSANSTFLVTANGEIWYKEFDTDWTAVDYSCIDGLGDFNKTTDFHIPTEKSVIFACKPPPQKATRGHHFYGIFSISCSMFALATVLVYAILTDKQNAHIWTIMSFSTAVFLLFLFLGVAHLISDGKTPSAMESSSCKIIAVTCHFFFVAMFSWLTMLSLDLWLSFRFITDNDPRTKNSRRFLSYCFLGWGIPILIITLSVSFEDGKIPPPKNGIAFLITQHCLPNKSLWEFLYGPSIVLSSFTILMFILTTKKLIEYKRCTEFTTSAIPNGKSYTLFVKLLGVIMFVWIIEAIAWTIRSANTSALAWQLFYTINCLEPVAVFFIFVFKWDILNALAEKSSLLNFTLTPALWMLARRRSKTTNFQSTEDDDEALMGEASPLSASRRNYTELSRTESDYFDDFEDTQKA